MRLRSAYAFATLLMSACCAQAVELRHITVRAGAEGLDQASFSVANRTAHPITCLAELAHWYSIELGRAEAGAELNIPLWRDPSTGAFIALNDKTENMPVEALWCGREGRAYETRAILRIERARQGAMPADITCRDEGDRLLCG